MITVVERHIHSRRAVNWERAFKRPSQDNHSWSHHLFSQKVNPTSDLTQQARPKPQATSSRENGILPFSHWPLAPLSLESASERWVESHPPCVVRPCGLRINRPLVPSFYRGRFIHWIRWKRDNIGCSSRGLTLCGALIREMSPHLFHVVLKGRGARFLRWPLRDFVLRRRGKKRVTAFKLACVVLVTLACFTPHYIHFYEVSLLFSFVFLFGISSLCTLFCFTFFFSVEMILAMAF